MREPDSLPGSITSARARTPSSSRERPSMNACFSLAAWYSAFSRRSPWARASSMSWTFLGRSISRSRLSSSRSTLMPRGVMGILSAILELLQGADGHASGLQLSNGPHRRASPRHRRVVWEAAHQGGPPQREGVLDRLGALRRVDHHLDLPVDDAVDAVGAPVTHLVDVVDVDPRLAQVGVGAGGGEHPEAELAQAAGHRHRGRLVQVLHREKNADRL